MQRKLASKDGLVWAKLVHTRVCKATIGYWCFCVLLLTVARAASLLAYIDTVESEERLQHTLQYPICSVCCVLYDSSATSRYQGIARTITWGSGGKTGRSSGGHGSVYTPGRSQSIRAAPVEILPLQHNFLRNNYQVACTSAPTCGLRRFFMTLAPSRGVVSFTPNPASI